MATPTRGIDQWREYFRSSNSYIFDIIESAIFVAAADCPDEFKLQRTRITELLFTARLNRCSHCNQVELSHVPHYGGNRCDARCDFAGGSKESKANSSRDDGNNLSLPVVSNFSYDEAEALTDEIEEEDQIIGEVLRIKEILNSYEDESDSVLFESLRRLQLMGLTIKVLKVTEIGKTVNGLRKHGSKQIRHLGRSLILEWKAIVDEWMEAEKQTREPKGFEGTPDSVNPTVVDGEEEAGLPSPPLDEGALFSTQNIDFAEFFDGMDDFGNPRNNTGESNKSKENVRKSPMIKQEVSKRREQPPKEGVALSKENKAQAMKPQRSVPKPNNRPVSMASGPGRPLEPLRDQTSVNPMIKTQLRVDKPTIQRRPVLHIEKTRNSGEDFVQVKLEASKRRLQERYQEAQNAKRQRTIQVMELQDLPKQGGGPRNANGKFSNNFNRNLAIGRR